MLYVPFIRPAHHRNQHHPLTPCNSIDPTRLDPREVERVRQAGSSNVFSPDALAKSLAQINVQESSSQSRSATRGESACVRDVKERLKGQQFDVFLSFAEEDKEFAEEVRHRIVSKLKLKVFVPAEGNVYFSGSIS